MSRRNSYIGGMNLPELKEPSRLVSFRLPASYDKKLTYLKLLPGGFTKWVLGQLDKLEIDEEIMQRLAELVSSKK